MVPQRRGGSISNFTKIETLSVSYKNQLLFEVSPYTLLLHQSYFSKTTILSPSVWSSRDFTQTDIWKKSLLICFEIFWVSPILTGRVLIGKRYFIWSIYAVYSFLSYVRKKNRSLVCISSKQRILWRWTHNFSVDKLTRNYPMVKRTAKHVFWQV